MKLHSSVKSSIKILVYCFFLIFPLSDILSSERDRKSLDLYLNLDNGQLQLRKVALISSPAPKPSYLKGGYKIEIASRDSEILYQGYFRDPGIIYYDILDTVTLALSGGIVTKDQSLFKIRIPYPAENAELSIFDLRGNLKFLADHNQLLSRIPKMPVPQGWEVDTVMYNGDPSNRIDIVFLGDGYRINDTALYSGDVQAFADFMFNNTSPYNEYRSYFNVYQVKVISQESGSDHPELNPPVYRNTALGTYYGCGGIDRLICADNDSVYAAAQSVPWYDQIVVLVNDPIYGGSGGSYLISFNGYSGKNVMMHELGHSFADLADEYLYGSYPGSLPNCNCDENSINPKWQSWIDLGSPGVGAFLGCSFNNLYRPTSNACMMMSLQNRYCVVCREQSIRSIYRYLRAYDDFSPSTDTLSLDTLSVQPFDLTTLTPNPHTLKVNWFVNSQFSYSGNPFNFQRGLAGLYRVKGSVYDTTYMVLDDPLNLLSDSREWQVRVGPYFVCGDANGDSSASISDVIFIINYLFKGGPYPVPSASADVNLDGKVSVSDVVYLINYLFKGGLEPCHL